MSVSSGAAAQVIAALRASYTDLLLSVPLVLGGFLVTGSVFYWVYIRPHTRQRHWSDVVRYFFPKQQYTSISARVDIWVYLINGLLVIPIFQVCVAVASVVSGVGINDLLAREFGSAHSSFNSMWSIVALQFLGFYFGSGLGQYFGHLSFHKVPVLWALHRAHHSAESANLFAYLRTHPIEVVLAGLVRVAGSAIGMGIMIYLTGGQLLPGTTTLIVWFNALYVIAGFRSLDHTHIPVSYGRFLDILVGSPVMHQVHHSAELHHRDVNMAGAGYIFDWLFGTLYVPERGETWRWGLRAEELGENNPHRTVRDWLWEPVARMSYEILGRQRRSGSAPAPP